MIVNKLLEDFCDEATYMKGFTHDTIRRYRSNISVFLKRTSINTTEELTYETVRSFFFDGRTKYHWSISTFLTYYKTLKTFFSWCKKHKHINDNPILQIDKPRLEKKLPKKLNKQEAMKLLNAVFNYPYSFPFLRYRNQAIFAMFIFAGLRKQELLNLNICDVDVENKIIFISQGKGRKDRIIPISDKLSEILKNYLEHRWKLKKTCQKFFTSFTYNAGLTEHGFNHLIKFTILNSGIKFSAHKLRHTFATLMLEGGCDIFSLSKMMGHSDIKTTTIYLAASAEHLRGQILKHPLNTPS